MVTASPLSSFTHTLGRQLLSIRQTTMLSDLRSTDTATRSPAPERPSPPASSTSRPLLRTFLVCFFAALYALAAIRWSLPPHSWVEKWIARRVSQDRAAWTRPGLRTVER